jgi:predicted dinucleotide-binding enzyme
MAVVAVVGAGNIGGTLARKWAVAGHQVIVGARDPAGPGALALAGVAGVAVEAPAEAVAGAEAVLFAVPGPAMRSVVEGLGAALVGVTVAIDATNNLGGGEMNAVAAIRAAAPGLAVARAFNSLGWENFADPDFAGVQADLLWCGPDGDAGSLVDRLIADVGLRPVRVGGLDQVRVVDALASLWFALALGQGLGRHLAFKVLTR